MEDSHTQLVRDGKDIYARYVGKDGQWAECARDTNKDNIIHKLLQIIARQDVLEKEDVA